MFVRRFVLLNLIVHVIIVISYVDRIYAGRCRRVPEGSGNKRSQSTGNFRVRLSEDSGIYTPGKQYTSKFKLILNGFSLIFGSFFFLKYFFVYL